ncbi:hypothetical protein PV327_002325 [Microctonus hyperodae]|uniref:Uncharacterized protein n=1 Tax=Microctonus hyperodae TaxID=165561 RepID=A0AA39FFC7_MICHY|nr:hypothetical protein PV327_002325 [Microctonus hyperodae]
MEQAGDQNDNSKGNSSPKSKQKKKSLCQMLMHKKTRVGCMEVSYNRDSDTNKNSRFDNSQHSSHTSTKLSLCCAMTERSRTPPQSLTTSRLSPTLSRTSVKSEIASLNGNGKTNAIIEKDEIISPLMQNRCCQECGLKRSMTIAAKEQRKSAYVDGE